MAGMIVDSRSVLSQLWPTFALETSAVPKLTATFLPLLMSEVFSRLSRQHNSFFRIYNYFMVICSSP